MSTCTAAVAKRTLALQPQRGVDLDAERPDVDVDAAPVDETVATIDNNAAVAGNIAFFEPVLKIN